METHYMILHHRPLTNHMKVVRGKGQPSFFVLLKEKAVIVKGKRGYCRRCDYYFSLEEGQLQCEGMYFCPHCLSFGRLTTNDWLYCKPLLPVTYHQHYLQWQGQLTDLQQPIATALVHHCMQEEELMVYAVTGAGKTEMMFEYIDTLLSLGCRVAYIAPRIDVVLEIGQRLQEAFPTLTIPILYGGHHTTQSHALYVSTVHQLVHFHHCFDAIIIDEVDAYPYCHNIYLEHLVHKALKNHSQCLYLSATVTKELAQKMKYMPTFRLSVRYHRNPLPVPKIDLIYNSYRYLQHQTPPKSLSSFIQQRQRPILLFVPSIHQLKKLYNQMCRWFPTLAIEYVYSGDERREEKIQTMRQTPYDILMTTTILERGVTFKNIDVYIFNAHHPRFTRQVLVQISGRVGRKKEAPKGRVVWLADSWTREMKAAYQLILTANKEREKIINDAMSTM